MRRSGQRKLNRSAGQAGQRRRKGSAARKSGAMLRLRVLLFASLRDKAGKASLMIDLPASITASELLRGLAERLPMAAGLLPSCRVAVDGEFANGRLRLGPDSELAVLPPVAGG